MIKIVSVAEMVSIEAATDASGVSYDEMMERAGRGVADVVLQVLGSAPETRGSRVNLVLFPDALHKLVGIVQPSAELLVNFFLLPVQAAPVLQPLEIGNGDAARICQYVENYGRVLCQ